jgi:hypothetical protein
MTFDEGQLFPFKPIKDINYQFIPRQLYCVKQANVLKQNYEQKNGFKYDIVVRIRPDLFLLDDTALDNDIENQEMDSVYMLDHDNWHGYCDRFYFSNSENMDMITDQFDWINYYSKIGGRNYGEGLLQFVTDYQGINVKRVGLKTCLLRTNGEQEGELIHAKNGTIRVEEDGRIFHLVDNSYI